MSSEKITLLLISEKKYPPDKRVAFSPQQCRELKAKYSGLNIFIEPSKARCISDLTYEQAGIETIRNPGDADIFFGIKEVPVENLLSGKTYFFFSHTIKKQIHNRKLLQALLDKKIEMVDYECLHDAKGNRTVAFGRFAGIVGAYNALRMWLEKKSVCRLPAASACSDMREMEENVRPFLKQLGGAKIALTGTGRVGSGAKEVFEHLGIRLLSPMDFVQYEGEDAVYTILSSRNYYRSRDNNQVWNETRFRNQPHDFISTFSAFAACSDILVSCHYWNPEAPALFSPQDIASPAFRISCISDVTCDIGGSIPTTIRASSIENPFYDIDRHTGRELPAFSGKDNISVCAVDNLPCELPYDASLAFGEMLIEHVIPEIMGNSKTSIEAATICRNGKLMPGFAYLQNFADGNDE
jgi:alanine dehydrogenase